MGALVKFAGGHDPGPLALPEPGEIAAAEETESGDQPGPGGPWGAAPETQGGAKPFLPAQPPVTLGGSATPDSEAGPWGPHRK